MVCLQALGVTAQKQKSPKKGIPSGLGFRVWGLGWNLRYFGARVVVGDTGFWKLPKSVALHAKPLLATRG